MNRSGFIAAVGVGLLAAATALGANTVDRIRIDGPIGPATEMYVGRGVDQAAADGAQCLIIQLDTPGGLLDSMQKIVKKMLASPIPTVVYIAPSGASAGSAGVFITLAGDVAVMAPATNIGAAHPVDLGGGQMDPVMKQKLENYTASYIETIAARRHRNVQWAKSAVRESASITAEQAVSMHVVDFLAADQADLLRQLDGRVVDGHTLHTASATVKTIPMSLRESFFQMIWRPETMYLLMLIAVYGIIGELSNPGAILPAVVGAIALVLVLCMVPVLPIDVAGIVLVGLAIVLFIADVFAPSHGVLTGGGIVAFFLGSMMMFDRSGPAFRLSLALVIPATLVTAAFFLLVVGAGLRAQLLPAKTGREAMIGRTASVVATVSPTGGKVFVEGEYWNAVSRAPIEPQRTVRIVAVEGLLLRVEPA